MNNHITNAFITATTLLITTFIIIILILLDWVDTGFFIGPLRFNHWMGIIGTSFIAIYTPIFYFLKRYYSKKIQSLINLHIYGFLISFLLISIHLAGQLSRPTQFYPELGEGIALFITMTLLVITGFLHRFQIIPKKAHKYYPPHFNRFYHVSITTAFYIIIIMHILLNMEIL